MIRATSLVAAGLLAMAGVLAAQQTAERPPQTAPQQTPATAQFAAGVDVVEVDVSVTDKNGQPITDLTARDFDVREDGQLQTIQTIYLATLDRTILKTTPAAPAAPVPTANPPERHELKQRVFIFVLDMTHLSAAGFTRSRDAITGFIKDGMTPADLVGVVVGDKMVGNRIGSDKDALLKAACRSQKSESLALRGDAHVPAHHRRRRGGEDREKRRADDRERQRAGMPRTAW